MSIRKLMSIVVILLSAAGTAAAQTYEEQMRTAAGAYERKDMATAVRIWKTWADKGEAEAQTLLGAMYWSGEGVRRDHREAAALYLRAAKQGYARAQNDIGFMYGFGEGIPPHNDIEAYKWLTLAIERYTVKNQDRREQAIEDKAKLASRMSRAQINEAERLAKAWKPVREMR